MRVLVTGGSGFIGTSAVAALIGRGHQVMALARNAASAEKLGAAGCEPVLGSIAKPEAWLPALEDIDAVVHLAATFDESMAAVDAVFVDALLRHHAAIARSGAALRIVYTGGVWLYGDMGGAPVQEGQPFNVPDKFRFMVERRAELFAAEGVVASVVHPALVWDETGGMISHFLDDARAGRAPRVVGSVETHWPMVHRGDLGILYALVAEDGRHGEDYHGVSEAGVRVGDIAEAVVARFEAPAPELVPLNRAIAELGDSGPFHAYDIVMEAPLTRERFGWRPAAPGVLDGIAALAR